MKKIISTILVFMILLGTAAAGVPEDGLNPDFGLKAFAASEVASGECGDNLTWTLDDSGKLTVTGSGKMSFSLPWYDYRTEIRSADISGATSIGDSAFYGCTSLTSIIISDSVTSIGCWAFEGCTSLTSITIPGSVKSIGDYAFYNCSSLGSVTVPDGVKSIENSVFEGCSSLSSVTIPGSVTSIGYWAFRDCSSLTTVTIPDSVTSISNYAFCDCTSLSAVVYDGSSAEWSSAVSVGSYDCNNDLFDHLFFAEPTEVGSGKCGKNLSWVLTDGGKLTITGSGKMFSWGEAADVPWYSDRHFVKDVEISGAASIADYTFYDCFNLADISIPDSVISIGDSAFCGCSALTSATVPDSVTSIGGSAFEGCSSLTAVTVSDSVTSISSGTFRDCSTLASIAIPDGVTLIGDSAFCGCSALASATIPDSVTSIGGSAFSGCAALSSVTIPDGVTCIGSEAFSGCVSLASVTIPDSVISIDDHAFSGCTALSSVTIHDGVTSIGNRAFYNCESLTAIVIPSLLEKISSETFRGCSALETVTIPRSVKTIETGAFRGDYYIEDVYYNGTEKEWNAISIGSKNDPILDADIYYSMTLETEDKSVSLTTSEAETVINKGTGLTAEKLTEGDAGTEAMFAVLGELGVTSTLYDISLVRNGKELQPSASVTVRIRIPDGYDAVACKVYDLSGDTAADMNATAEDGYFVFTANHLGYYAVVQTETRTPCEINGHTEVVDAAVEPTCTETGLTEGKHCSVCNEVIVAQTTVDALGHTEVVDVAVEPTCTETGLTEGKHCSVCNEVIAAQTIVDVLGHNWKDATCTSASTCTVCGEESGKPVGHSYDDKVDGTCNNCGIRRETTEKRTVMHMFRMYDPNSGEHFYTGSEAERENLVAAGWEYEGVGFTFSMKTGSPVYRLYEPATGEHLYTMDEEEKAALLDSGWNFEGIAFNSAYDTEVPQYRLHNPNATRGAYHFTASAEERDFLIAAGWEDQGIGFYSAWK